MKILDVISEYSAKRPDFIGSIQYEFGYQKDLHEDEVKMAEWLWFSFGGNIKLIKESPNCIIRTPDYVWNGKMWELKSLQSAKAADNAVRKALSQILDNPGGIILDLKKKIDVIELETIVTGRIKRGSVKNIDVMFVKDYKLVKVMRYKK